MAIGPAGLAMLQGGIQIGGNIGSNLMNRKMAREQRQWSEDMMYNQRAYDKQRWDEQNAYNLEMWNLQNEYNSPQAQMARFQKAGLNPHLIYGKGTPGNATGAPQASALRSPDVKPYNRAQAQSVMQGMNAFSNMMQFKNLQAQTDNVKANTDTEKQKLLLQQQQLLLDMLNYKRTARMDKKEEAVFQHEIDMVYEQLQSQRISNEKETINLNWLPKEKEMKWALDQASLRLKNKQVTGQEFLNELNRQLGIESQTRQTLNKAKTDNTKADTRIKRANAELTEAGLTGGSSKGQQLARFLHQQFKDTGMLEVSNVPAFFKNALLSFYVDMWVLGKTYPEVNHKEFIPYK